MCMTAALQPSGIWLSAHQAQSYGKTREMQKESSLFFSFPSASNFGDSQSYGKSRAGQNKFICFSCRDEVTSQISFAKLR